MEANGRRLTNLETFLTRVTPSLPSHSRAKTCFRDPNSLWRSDEKDVAEYFTLYDLWDQYAECSAYGLGIPVVLPTGEMVVQYFVPYLSALQIYTGRTITFSRNGIEESESDSWSDDSTSEKLSPSWDAISEGSVYEVDNLLPGRERFGHLYLHYVEWDSPYQRIPLVDKVFEMAQEYPGLTTLKSVELSPASWMSIAWYPIYQVPSRGNSKDLSACFLTYHTISSIFQDSLSSGMEDTLVGDLAHRAAIKAKGENRITLNPFGLATYRMQGTVWRNPGTSDSRRIEALHATAECWLKQKGVDHPDFNFFTTHPC